MVEGDPEQAVDRLRPHRRGQGRPIDSRQDGLAIRQLVNAGVRVGFQPAFAEVEEEHLEQRVPAQRRRDTGGGHVVDEFLGADREYI